MSVKTIKMMEKGTVVDFCLTMNPKFNQLFRGVVINYPRGHLTEKIHTKNRKVIEYPAICIRVRSREGEFVVNARSVKAAESTEITQEEIQKLQAILDK